MVHGVCQLKGCGIPRFFVKEYYTIYRKIWYHEGEDKDCCVGGGCWVYWYFGVQCVCH